MSGTMLPSSLIHGSSRLLGSSNPRDRKLNKSRFLFSATLLVAVLCCLRVSAHPISASLTIPTPGSVLPGPLATFSWTAGTGVTDYTLAIGTTGTASLNLFNSGSTTATSATVSNLPAGATAYATLSSEIGGV